jgi:quinoprotein dehydrogenase-associated probable ABC transporter substrate-binding protein
MFQGRSAHIVFPIFVCFACALTAPANAQQAGEIINRTELRVCADPSNLPFSDEKKDGFENKVAMILGEELTLPVSFVFFPQVIGFVRNTLGARTCDLIMGTVTGDDIVQTTNPYYYSTYVAVFSDRAVAFTDFDDPRLKSLRIGIVSATPPANLLVAHDLMANAKPYALMVDTRFESPAHEMINDLTAGAIDIGLLWGPIAGYYIKRDNLPLTMAVLPNQPEAPRMDYHIAMGVRANEPEWRRQVNAAILKRQPEIAQVLRSYGVPLLDERGRLLPP